MQQDDSVIKVATAGFSESEFSTLEQEGLKCNVLLTTYPLDDLPSFFESLSSGRVTGGLLRVFLLRDVENKQNPHHLDLLFIPMTDPFGSSSMIASNPLNEFITVPLPAQSPEERIHTLQVYLSPTMRKQLSDPSGYGEMIMYLPMALYRTTEDGRFLMVNPAMRELLGIPPDEPLEELRAESFYVRSEDRQHLLKALEKQSTISARELELKRRDGKIITVRAYIHKLPEKHILEGALKDITEQKKAEQSLIILNRVLEILNSGGNFFEDTFPRLAHYLMDVFGPARVSVALLEESSALFRIYSVEQKTPHQLQIDTLPTLLMDSSAADDVLKGITHVTPCLDKERERPAEQQLFEAGYRSRINIPLISEDTPFGSLNLAWTIPYGFKEEDTPLLEKIGRALTLAIIRSQQIDETRLQAKVLEHYASLTQQSTKLSTINAILLEVHRALRELYNPDVVFLWFDMDEVLHPELPELAHKVRSSVVAHMKPDACLLIPHISTADEKDNPSLFRLMKDHGLISCALKVLSIQGLPRGGIFVARKTPYSWSPYDRWFFHTIGQFLLDQYLKNLLQKQLKRHYDDLKNLLEGLPIGVCTLSANGLIYSTNTIASELLQQWGHFSEDGRLIELSGRSFESILQTAQTIRQPLVLESDQPTGRWLEVMVHSYRPESPNTFEPRWLLLIRDITEEHLLKQRMDASERLASLGRLVAGIAHDFNNALNAISGFAQLIAHNNPNNFSIHEQVVQILNQVHHAASMIRQLMDYARTSPLELQPMNLTETIHTISRTLERLLSANIELHLDLPDEPLYILGDATRIRQVLMNLVINARDAIVSQGRIGIKLSRVHTVPDDVMEPPEKRADEWVLLSVEDTGCGIDPEILPHIFEPYFTTKKEEEGTGLGLSQVYGIVKQHGGTIQVISSPGKGTTFNIYLPLSKPGPSVDQHEPKTETRLFDLPTHNILLVEDHPDVRNSLENYLKILNQTYISFGNGTEAFEYMEKEGKTIDLLMTDLDLPGLDGDELIRQSRKLFPNLKALLITGFPLPEDHMADLPDVPVLTKPLSLETLYRTLQSLYDEMDAKGSEPRS